MTVGPIDFPFVHFFMWVFTVFRENHNNEKTQNHHTQIKLELPTARNITSGAPDLAYMQKVSPG